MRQSMIDINKFYAKGYCTTVALRSAYGLIKQELDADKWIKDPDGIYKRVPSWSAHGEQSNGMSRLEFEKHIAQKSIDVCPDNIVTAINEIISARVIVGPWLELYDLKLDFIDIWDGLETELDWHWDGPGRSDVVSLIYLNELDWPAGKGGAIATGERNIEPGSHWLKDYDDVIAHEHILPAGRTQIWLNNTNPRFVHKPLPLTNKNDARLTLTFGCSLIMK